MNKVDHPRIYIVISTFHPLVGGAETQAFVQSRALRAKGYDATILTFRYKKAWSSQEVIEETPVIRIAGCLLNGRERYPRALQQVVYMLALLLLGWTLWQRRDEYDILHVYQLGLLALPTALICRFTGKPLLIAVRSAGSGKSRDARATASLLAGPLHPTTSALQVDGLSWVDGDLEGLLRLGYPISRLTHALLKSVHTTIILLSSRMKDYLAAHDFDLPGTLLIPNGVDIRRYHPLPSIDFHERAHVVVCVAKLRYEKGVDVLLQAWRLVQQERPSARLILVGDGPLQQQLAYMVEVLEITESVQFAGLRSDIPAQLHRGGIAALPSRWEGMPNALLEAMAYGLPCVATRVSGSEDLIQHERNGLLVESEDYEGMAQALLTLLRNPLLAQQYGQAARTTIEQRYSLEHITDIYVKLYQSLYHQRQKKK